MADLVIVQDVVGNQTTVTVTVDSIDKESPIVKVEYEATPAGRCSGYDYSQ
ncbi:hypothetical protein [Faecalicoccus pleomorphus]|uniref:hypothetical protein n=1 Tax=Faecalicoccus pleomorphus TaxID=1323 RepID=UPI0029436F8E|nr:hypothetical protein [Faecalicoccus pleomorphus]